MKVFKFIFLIAVASHTAYSVVPYLELRSQGANLARFNAGIIDQTYPIFECDNYGVFTLDPGYSRSFDTSELTRCLFGIDKNESITISGSNVANRTASDWLADYFYLPIDYQSKLAFDPVIDNFFVDINFFFGMENWFPGYYLALYTPLVHTRTQMNPCEETIDKGSLPLPAGYLTPDQLLRGRLLNSMTDYLNGENISPINQTVVSTDTATTQEISTIVQKLRQAKVSCDTLSRTRFADIRFIIGWNALYNECNYVGPKIHIAAPVGNRPDGEFILEPIVGNSHHWELGLGIRGYQTVWADEAQINSLGIFYDGYLAHMFPARQRRTFDLKGKPFSRYMLAERMNPIGPNPDNLQGNGIAPTHQFAREFAPVANLTQLVVDSKVEATLEFVVIAHITHCTWVWDIGYNFWLRGCESLLPRNVSPIEVPTGGSSSVIRWALKGDAQVFGFMAESDGSLAQNQPIALSASQSGATINSGLNFPIGSTGNPPSRNPNIDGAQPATAGVSNIPLLFQPNVAVPGNQVNTSIQPGFFDANDIDLCNSVTRGLSNKLFTYFGYAWNSECFYNPLLGIGAEVEWGVTSDNQITNDLCRHCPRCSLSQWSVWLKGGFAF